MLLCSFATGVLAGYNEDVGYAALEAELGTTPPDGSGLAVSIVEACLGDPCAWTPNPGSRLMTIWEGGPPVSSPYSNHATQVGRRFYGDLSTTQGIGISPGPAISAYETNEWLQPGYLRLASSQNLLPLATSSRIANHSWVGDINVAGTPEDIYNLETLRRLDWVIESDDIVHVVAYANGNQPLLNSAFNVIAVNRALAASPQGSHPVTGDPAYDSVRTRPHIVAPEANTSNATPRVSSAAALLMHASQLNPSLSNGSATNSRTGVLVRNAERSEVIKAMLMAGAERATNNTFPTSGPLNITDYRADASDQTANGLDRRFGAGQLNIYNSYQILAGGEQDSDEDGGGSVGDFGFDYDPAFGGRRGSNAAGTYYFTTGGADVEFVAALAWNVEIHSSFGQAATLRNLDLFLYDVSDPGNWVLVEQSASTIDNTENIRAWLNADTDYALQVRPAAGQNSFTWDYGIAWRTRVTGDVNGDETVDVGDLMLLERSVTDQVALDQQQRARADVHPTGGDGTLDVSDLMVLQQRLLSTP